MKKNLRIVSVAAALLAVAPVAATAVSTVSAAPITSVTHLGNVTLPASGSTVNVKPNISLNTKAGSVSAAISVSFSATVDGTTANANFGVNASNPSKIQLFKGSQEITDLNQVTEANAGEVYKVSMTNVGLNFGSQNANKKINLNFGSNWVAHTDSDTMTHSIEVKLDKNGVINLYQVAMDVTAKDFANPAVVTWHNGTTGAAVNSANIQLYAGADDGKMNISQVLNAVPVNQTKGNAYYATQLDSDSSNISYSNNLKDALKAAGVDVDAQGWFVAPQSFTFNLIATSNKNNATATLPVTVNVPNAKVTTVPSQTKTIMHNAYVYKTSKKRANKVTLKKGTEVTTYGGAYTFKNGKQYYKIGNDTEKTYVKVANFN
ncbi:SLAP domain-containing protein [Lactobacillus sp. N54.MGS-719]|uniref:SLAP domain-containing protein n=1 Tax=Lactobacillus sp. N54.MGS-719 TaxID=1637512 RepID=UPI000623A270|nr:SLAP domain-containing protein [Lactobacillus sp. N54.MGS-719]